MGAHRFRRDFSHFLPRGSGPTDPAGTTSPSAQRSVSSERRLELLPLFNAAVRGRLLLNDSALANRLSAVPPMASLLFKDLRMAARMHGQQG